MMQLLRNFLLVFVTLTLAPKATSEDPPVLLFVPVGKQTLELMRDNVQALSNSYHALEFFFAHYDGPQGKAAYENEDWYRNKIRGHACEYHASKPTFIKDQIVNKLHEDRWLKKFRYFWFADDNMDLKGTNVQSLVTYFARSGAAIGQPSVEHTWWTHLTWQPESGCAYRYVPLVEVITFMLLIFPFKLRIFGTYSLLDSTVIAGDDPDYDASSPSLVLHPFVSSRRKYGFCEWIVFTYLFV